MREGRVERGPAQRGQRLQQQVARVRVVRGRIAARHADEGAVARHHQREAVAADLEFAGEAGDVSERDVGRADVAAAVGRRPLHDCRHARQAVRLEDERRRPDHARIGRRIGNLPEPRAPARVVVAGTLRALQPPAVGRPGGVDLGAAMHVRIGLPRDEAAARRSPDQDFAPGLVADGHRREAGLVRQLRADEAHDALLVARRQHAQRPPVALQAGDGVDALEQAGQRQVHLARRPAKFGAGDGAPRGFVHERLHARERHRQRQAGDRQRRDQETSSDRDVTALRSGLVDSVGFHPFSLVRGASSALAWTRGSVDGV